MRLIALLLVSMLLAFCTATGIVAQGNEAPEKILFGKNLTVEIGKHQELYDLSRAVAMCEGYYVPGTLARRNNNPGNLKMSNTPKDQHGHTIFPTITEGWLNLWRVLSGRYSGMSPKEMNVAGYAEDPNWHLCVERSLRKIKSQ